jgi:hypothetical protein
MLGLDFLSPHRRATSSGSVSLNSPLAPSHAMHVALDESARSSRRNCQSWTWPPPSGAPVGPPLTPPAAPIREHVRCRRPNLSGSQKSGDTDPVTCRPFPVCAWVSVGHRRLSFPSAAAPVLRSFLASRSTAKSTVKSGTKALAGRDKCVCQLLPFK